jgi:ComF family protein
MKIIEHILGTIAPHECLGCKAEGAALCFDCRTVLPSVVPRCYRCQQSQVEFRTCASCQFSSALYSVRPMTVYEGLAKGLIWQLKFERLRAGAETVAETLATLPYDPDEILVPVPTATSRVRQRGYDQAAVIARELARHTGLEHSRLLSRLGQQRQVGKSRQQRKSQMKELFLPTGNVTNKRIVLVDDVITTGATLEACAGILKKAGAKQVRAVVFAAA